MLGGQPSHGWQLCIPLVLHAGGSGFGLCGGSDLRTCLLVRWWGAGALVVVGPKGVGLLDVFCSGDRFYVLLGPRLCFVSFCVLVCVFWEMVHGWVRGLSGGPSICVPWSTSRRRMWLSRCEASLGPPVEYLCWLFQGGASFVGRLCLAFVSFRACSLLPFGHLKGKG